MLKLVYDVKCGFKELFITEKDCEIDLAVIIEANKDALENDVPDDEAEEWKLANPITEEDFYELFKDDIDGLMHYLEESGQLECEETFALEYYGKAFFAAVCKEEGCGLPGYFEMENCRLVYEPNVKSEFYFYNAMTAKEVFDFLKQNFGCSRKVYNLCVDSSKLGIDGAAKTIIQTVQIFDSTK